MKMEKLITIEKAFELLPAKNLKLRKLFKIGLDYDYIFDVVDDENLNEADFGDY